MEFLGKLNSLTKSVAKTAADKATDAIGSGKVAIKIRKEQNTIDEQYLKIGEYFYRERNAGMKMPPVIESYCVAVDVANALIVELEEERDEYRDVDTDSLNSEISGEDSSIEE